MNHMGLFHNPKFQVFHANIQVSYSILHNLYKDVFITTSINLESLQFGKRCLNLHTFRTSLFNRF